MKLYLLQLLAILPIQTTFSCIFLKLSNGILKGRIATIPSSKKTFFAFQEIPYAAPPVGNLRFQPPQPVEDWEGVLDARRNTKICYQMSSNNDQETEDCLYLNVYTPQLPSKTKHVSLPVMVYIYGGGFVIGDATHQSYGPEFFMKHDVIIVTLNYRLGVFGFLSTQDGVIPGNNGLKDQLFALQWVNRNIHHFGGDPSKVTIFGQSAGGASVGYHLINKKSEGLYRAAIMESSSVLCPWGYQRFAKKYAYTVASYINSSITEENTSDDVLSVMLTASAKDVDVAQQQIAMGETYDTAQIFQGYYFAPVIEPESDHAVLTEKMFEVVRTGSASRVPIIVGINSEEGVGQSTDLNFLKALMSRFDNDLKALVPNDMNIDSDSSRTEAGRRIRELYSGDNLMQDDPAASIKYMSDTSFSRPVIKYAQMQSQFSEVYFYQFSYDGKLGNVSVIVEGTDRVGHNEEIPYLWRVSTAMFNNYDLSIYPENDLIAHSRLLSLWTTFAKTLNPTPEKSNLLENIIWEPFSLESDFSYLNINETLEIKNRPKESSSSGWNAIYDEFGIEPFDTY